MKWLRSQLDKVDPRPVEDDSRYEPPRLPEGRLVESGRSGLTRPSPVVNRFGIRWQNKPDLLPQSPVVELPHTVQRDQLCYRAFGTQNCMRPALQL